VKKLTATLLMGAALVLATPTNGVLAATPPDAFVQALAIDDIISLDPAEIFEFSGAEYGAQVYDRLITYPVDDVEDIQGHVAESWEISEDGKTYVFRIRDGITFHSGNALTAEDVAFSLQRVVKLDMSPAFILTQFGFTAENVEEKIRATGPLEVTIEVDQAYAPTFFLYCLTAGVGSVVDKELVMANEVDGDLGYAWLKTNSAGSGPFSLRAWRPNESLTLDGNPEYWKGAPAMSRVITRHIAEAATQQLLIEQGDIDVARNLGPDQVASLEGNPDIEVKSVPKGAIFYLGLNQKNEYLAKPEVRQALKYLIPYQELADTVVKGAAEVHQAFLPKGFLGALEDTPFSLDVERAKELLAEAGLTNGFSVSMDVRSTSPVTEIAQAVQAVWAEAGIDLELIPGDGAQTLTKYRARNHDIYIGRWGPDYQDPHTNADTFARNPDNSDDAQSKPLAWRNAWDIPEMTAMADAAVLERDAEKRAEMYREIQRIHQETSPFVIMFQDIETIAERTNVQGTIWGPSFDDNRYWQITKN
jgi:peptide/nickel transport system substrate-binding protein